MLTIPAYVKKHMEMSGLKKYIADVQRKWPLEGGEKELEYGDEGKIYCRTSRRELTIIEWDDFNYTVHVREELKEGKFTDYWISPVWFYKKD